MKKGLAHHRLCPTHALVVDDDDHILRMSERILEELCPGVAIDTAETLDMAEAAAQHEHFDLIVTDMWYPRSEQEGFSTIRRGTPSGALFLRSIRHGDMGQDKREVPVIVLSDDDMVMRDLQAAKLEGSKNPTVFIDKKDFQHGKGYDIGSLRDAFNQALYKLEKHKQAREHE